MIFSRYLMFVWLLLFAATSVHAQQVPQNVRGNQIGAGAIKWQWNANPDVRHFGVYVDGSFVDYTRDPQFYSYNLWVGEHSIEVEAVGWDYGVSARSPAVKVIVSDSGSGGGAVTANSTASTVSDRSGPVSPPGNLRGTQTGPGTVRWEWDAAPAAARYQVTVDGAVTGEVSGLDYTSNGLWVGEHSLTVKAVTDSGQYSEQSQTLKAVVTEWTGTAIASAAAPASTGSVGVPQNPRGQQIAQGTVRWEWDQVSGASRYQVTVDGAVAGEVADTNYSSTGLWVGEHSMTVKAISAGNQYSAQSNTVKIQVSDTASSVAPPPQQDQPLPPSNETGLIDPVSWTIPEAYEKPGYELVFSDEFNGGNINPNRWHTQLRWDGEFNGERYEYRVVNGENQFYVNILSGDQEHQNTVVPVYNPFEFNGSRVAIRAIRNPLKRWDANLDHGSLYEMVSQQHFLSGALATHDIFYQKYGYFEARIKIPNHVGTFPAFWLYHQKRRWEGTKRTEIDIMENLGHAPWYIYNTFHYFNNVSTTYGGDSVFVRPYPNGQIYTGTDYSQDFHTYAVSWEPGYIAWYIDGNKVSEVWNDNVDYEELYLKINLAMGGYWTNFPANSGGLGRDPANYYPNSNDLQDGVFNNPALEIDWVRVYKKR